MARLISNLNTCAEPQVTPRCPHFGICGACSLQHLVHESQLALKQQRLLHTLAEVGGISPEVVLKPLTGAVSGYRRKARLSVKYVPQKGGALVGFRETRGAFVAELLRCETLHPSVGLRIGALRQLITDLHARARIPQIEAAVGDAACALVFRHLDPLEESDKDALCVFARQHGVHVYLQPGNAHTVQPLYPPEERLLCYRLPDFQLEMNFAPMDFIQVNADINRSLVSRVVGLLEPRDSDAVLDLYCGIGNFTLALARRGGRVLGLEAGDALVERARHNAAVNRMQNVEFLRADLGCAAEVLFMLRRGWDKLCLDPPRTGAVRVVENLAPPYPRRIAYVSCNPQSLARDAALLVHRHGYRFGGAGIVDMFPHTDHIESLALFLAP